MPLYGRLLTRFGGIPVEVHERRRGTTGHSQREIGHVLTGVGQSPNHGVSPKAKIIPNGFRAKHH